MHTQSNRQLGCSPGCDRWSARDWDAPPELVRAGRFRCVSAPPAGPRAGAGLESGPPAGFAPPVPVLPPPELMLLDAAADAEVVADRTCAKG